MSEWGEPCTADKGCTMHNLHCGYPNCLHGEAKKAHFRMEEQARLRGDRPMPPEPRASEYRHVGEIERLRSVNADLLEALEDLHGDCVEYARINNLFDERGRPATNHAMRRAAEAIAFAKGEKP
jgi:hypothetical protein